MTDQLELRLSKLSSSAVLRPTDESAIRHLEAWPPRVGRPAVQRRAFQISAAAAAVLVTILIANVVAAYFAPRYERALAGSGVGPVSQKFLAAFGLNDGNVTTVNDSATSSGHTVALAAGYADGLRTVLFLSVDGRGLTGDPKGFGMNPGDYGLDLNALTLSDQFGRTYGFGTGVMGPNELLFEPLGWPASSVGARLTLHIAALDPMWLRESAVPIQGDWTLHATLISEPAHTLTLPAPVHADQATYTFTEISASETEMVVRWTVDSALNDQLRNPPTPDSKTDPMASTLGQKYFTPRVYNQAGAQLQMEMWGFTWPKTGPAEGEMTVFINGPGRYRVQLGSAVESRWVVVP